jgi:hypothetical protein
VKPQSKLSEHKKSNSIAEVAFTFLFFRFFGLDAQASLV